MAAAARGAQEVWSPSLSRPRGIAATVATGVLLAASALPFVALFPEPPAFGREAIGIVATVAILATLGTSTRGTGTQRADIVRRAALVFVTTGVAIGLNILRARAGAFTVPTPDLLPRLFDLQGEDIDDAILYEVWLETWLACAVIAVALARAYRGRVGRAPPAAPETPAAPHAPWNPATILLMVIGCGALAGAVLEGHRSAAFLARAAHVGGTIASADSHPRIRFVTETGSVVEFTQNGSVSRPLGAEVPVAYDTRDPSGTARADTFWVNWSDVLGLLWVGAGFTLFPFFGFRATFRAGRW